MDLNRFVRKLKWYDLQFVKLSVFFFTLFLVVVWPGFLLFVLSFSWQFYLVLMLLSAFFVFRRFF